MNDAKLQKFLDSRSNLKIKIGFFTKFTKLYNNLKHDLCMFLKQEKPQMDDFERRKNIGSKGKISIFKKKFLTDTLAKMSQNIFAYSFFSQNILSIYFYFEI